MTKFRNACKQIRSNPKRLFLIDGMGATVSTFLLGVVLVDLKGSLAFRQLLCIIWRLCPLYLPPTLQGQGWGSKLLDLPKERTQPRMVGSSTMITNSNKMVDAINHQGGFTERTILIHEPIFQ